jgi:uncharacterized protein YeaO (DUF488 family)
MRGHLRSTRGPTQTDSSRLAVATYRYGEGKLPAGLCLGVTRQVPRGVKRADYAARGYFDLWLPLLAPSQPLVTAFKKDGLPFAGFARRYRAEMRRPEARQAIQLLAAVARHQPVNLGCFCRDAERCHRSVLQALVAGESAASALLGGRAVRS